MVETIKKYILKSMPNNNILQINPFTNFKQKS